MSAPARELEAAQKAGLLLGPSPLGEAFGEARSLLPSGAIAVRGEDRQGWLNGLVTADLAKLKSGAGAFSLAVQKNGKVLGELWVLLGAEDLWVLGEASRLPGLSEHFERHLVMEDCELELLEPPPRTALVFGPLAVRVADAARGLGARVLLLRRAGLDVALVAGPAEAIDAALGAVEGLTVATPAGLTRLRAEHGLPAFGVDYGEQSYPQEGAVERDAVAFDKGCYLGQEAVFMLEKRGHVSKRLVQLEVAGTEPIEVGALITGSAGAEVGHVTSAAERESDAVALGVVRYKVAREGTELAVAGRPARVTALLAVPR